VQRQSGPDLARWRQRLAGANFKECVQTGTVSKVWALGESVDLTFPGFIPFHGEDCFGGDAKTKHAKSEPLGATGRRCSPAQRDGNFGVYIYRFDNE